VIEEQPAGGGQRHASARPIEQLRAELALQGRNLLAESRLRHVQSGRRLEQAPGITHTEEVAQLFEFHFKHALS
jgi:hypothetical protein